MYTCKLLWATSVGYFFWSFVGWNGSLETSIRHDIELLILMKRLLEKLWHSYDIYFRWRIPETIVNFSEIYFLGISWESYELIYIYNKILISSILIVKVNLMINIYFKDTVFCGIYWYDKLNEYKLIVYFDFGFIFF